MIYQSEIDFAKACAEADLGPRQVAVLLAIAGAGEPVASGWASEMAGASRNRGSQCITALCNRFLVEPVRMKPRMPDYYRATPKGRELAKQLAKK